MSQKEKLLQKFLDRPESLKYAQICLVLQMVGFVQVPVKNGSHEIFKHPQLQYNLTIPVHNNDCKKYYKIKASSLIKDYHLF